jgi:integrase
MSTLVIALSDILLDPKNPTDLSKIPQSQALQVIKQSYGFLSDSVEVSIENGIAMITLPDDKSKKVNDALDWFERGLKKAVKRSKLKDQRLHFHSLRHSFASWLAQKGTSIYEIQKLLGHSDIKTTQIYAHLLPNELHKTVGKLEGMVPHY